MASLAPQIKFAALASDGTPLVGGKLYAYDAGTTTPKDTYTDSTLGSTNTNPVILNSRGEATVWLSGAYKLVLKDAADVTIWTEDNVADGTTNTTFTGATLAGSLTVSSTAVTWSGNPTHSGNHTFSGNVTVQGTSTLGNASTDTTIVNGRLYGLSLHNNAGSMTGSTNQYIGSGTFTPTLYNGANVASSSHVGSHWFRVGNVVHASGHITIDPTAATTYTDVGMSTPIFENFGVPSELSGIAIRYTIGAATAVAIITADGTNNRAYLEYYNDTDVTNSTWAYNYSYLISHT
jgi:hypothetical protein